MNHIEEANTTKNQVVYATIGAFDGVHIGHQHLIRSMVKQAQKDSAQSLVITFHPHPAVLLRSLSLPFYITTPSEKKSIFHTLGVVFVLDLKFTKKMSGMDPDQFMDMILDQYPISQLWLGKDFALGKKRSGNLTVLREIGKEKGISIIECPHLEDINGKISSSEIRNWIITGNFSPTTIALNRYYSLEGNVIYGDSRGREIGFPTANLEVWEGKLLPKPGVYATWITIDDQIYPSVTNVGVRPTFESTDTIPRIEAHIFNFDEDIYKKQVQLHFVENIRIEKKFNSIDELINQIQRDARRAEEILNNVKKQTGLFT
jgi:riboflavin kinase/FMN adenylyltransferase